MQKHELINKFYQKQNLNTIEAERLMTLITKGELNETEIALVLMFYKTNAITTNELLGFRKILLQTCTQIKLPFEALDVCGTGGDGKDTFNISTLSTFVIASCGYKVAKHGNYGMSSICGSSTILEYFGYKFTNDEEILLQQLEENNLCFLHAPLFHPALKHVAHTRKIMATKTIFNIIGPLVNPCNISHQFIGVNSLETMRIYTYLLQRIGVKYSLVHSIDGYDEISLTNAFKVVNTTSEKIIHPNELEFQINEPESLFSGSTVKGSATIFLNVLQNKASDAQKNAVIINSAFAIQLVNKKPIRDCIAQAKEALESLKTFHLFKNLITKTHEYAR